MRSRKGRPGHRRFPVRYTVFWDCERASGFTLLEAMAALLLIGALSAVAIPGMVRWLAYWELRAAAERLTADLRECQSRAEAEGVFYELRFWRTRPDYMVYRGVEHVRTVDNKPGIAYATGILPLPDTHLRFNPRGTGIQGGTIWLCNRFGDRMGARIYPDSGVVIFLGP